MNNIRQSRRLFKTGMLSLPNFLKIIRSAHKKNKLDAVRAAIAGDRGTLSPSVKSKVAVNSTETFKFYSRIWNPSAAVTITQPAVTTITQPAVTITQPGVTNFPTWTASDVDTALSKCSNSAPGKDCVNFSQLADIHGKNPAQLTGTFNQVCSTTVPGIGWADARVTLIHKKGDTSDPGNYRPIAVLPTVTRLYHKILANWLQHFIKDNNILSPAQKGFASGQNGLSAHILSLNSEIQRVTPVHVLLIDLRKAFDSVSHQALFKRLREIKLPSWFIQYLLHFYQSAAVTIKCADGETDSISIKCGVLQGDPLSPFLFNIVFDTALRGLLSSVRAFADGTYLHLYQQSPSGS